MLAALINEHHPDLAFQIVALNQHLSIGQEGPLSQHLPTCQEGPLSQHLSTGQEGPIQLIASGYIVSQFSQCSNLGFSLNSDLAEDTTGISGCAIPELSIHLEICCVFHLTLSCLLQDRSM